MKAKEKETAAKIQLICPKCGKPAVRRENSRAGVAYLHLTKHGTTRHFIEDHTSSDAARHLPLEGEA